MEQTQDSKDSADSTTHQCILYKPSSDQMFNSLSKIENRGEKKFTKTFKSIKQILKLQPPSFPFITFKKSIKRKNIGIAMSVKIQTGKGVVPSLQVIPFPLDSHRLGDRGQLTDQWGSNRWDPH